MRQPEFDILSGPTEVSVDATAGGKTLATLLGAALSAGLRRLTLIVQGAGVSWASGAAVAGVNDLPAGTHQIDCTKRTADLMTFVTAAGTVKMSVVQEA